MGSSGPILACCNRLDGLYRAVVAGNVVPIYEYQCQSCQKTFEYMQRMSEERKTECEECKGSLERLISNTSFALKGGGWYKDLYASTKKDTKGAGDSSSAASKETGASSSSSDASSSKPSSDSSASAASSTPAASAPAASAPASSTGSGSKSSD